MVDYQGITEFSVMGRKKLVMPNYLLHAPTGQARVIMNGKTVYLGKFGSPESHAKYQQMLAHVLATGGLPDLRSECMSVRELATKYLEHLVHESPNSREPRQQELAIRDLVGVFGDLPADEFSPLKLIGLRARWIAKPLARATVNMYHSYTIRCFRWGVERELIPAEVWQSLQSVQRVTERKVAKPTKVVEPVAWEDVEKVQPFVSRILWDAIQVQWLTGMRASEVLGMTPGMIDQSDWSYRPIKHKTGYRGKKRVVYLGPRSQAILLPYLDRPADKPLFSPKEAQEERFAAMRAARKTKVQPSQVDRSKEKPERTPGDAYNAGSYGKAIREACKKAGIKPWGSHQLRHAAATRFRQAFGLDATQAVLGHSNAKITEVYADLDLKKAKQVADELG